MQYRRIVILDYDPGIDPDRYAKSWIIAKPGLHCDNIGSGDLPVTENLSVALDALRNNSEARTFWIDAICINQQDVNERSAQVERMRDIYSMADRVLIWLGLRTEQSDLGIETLTSISGDMQLDEDTFNSTIARDSTTGQLHNNPEALLRQGEKWLAVNDLFCRPWFTRLWIWQEVTLASNAIIIAGSAEIPWTKFREAFWWIRTQIIMAPLLMKFFDNAVLRRVGAIADPQVSHSPALAFLISATKRSLCLDPKDRIYALLSITGDVLGIKPDYSKSIEEVYKDVVIRHILFTRTLDMLISCELNNLTSTSRLNLPSWVPDFSVAKGTNHLPGRRSGGSSAYELLDSGDDVLLIEGVQAATVNYVSSAAPITGDMEEIISTCKTWTPPYIWTSASHIEVYARTLVGDRFRELLPGSRDTFPSANHCKKSWYDCVILDRTENPLLDKEATLYLNSLRETLPGRAFVTTTEEYCGLAPGVANEGDIICIALGSSSPLLLRSAPGRPDCYHLVGGCFVHGLMEAEALLGPLPAGYYMDWVLLEGRYSPAYVHNGTLTQEDPRLEPLPEPWRLWKRPSSPAKPSSRAPISPRAALNLYHNLDTGEVTRIDPRLTSRALRAKGINVRQFALV